MACRLAWKYLPEIAFMVHRCKAADESPVFGPAILTEILSYKIHPKVTAECSSVREDWKGPVVQLLAGCGCSRWRGVKEAKINSELRLIVKVSAKDESLVTVPDSCTDEPARKEG